MHAQRLIEDIDVTLADAPFFRPGGSLLIMVGLPGVGKSHLVAHLQQIVPCVVVSTDGIRLFIRETPTYTAAEVMYMYEICYSVIDRRLRKGQRVIFDGSNYLQARRQRALSIAARHNAPAAVVHVQAAEEVTRARLQRRMSSPRKGHDLSDAGWSVYQWMVEAQEPIAVPHFVADTTSTQPEVLAEQVRQYWMACEEEFCQINDRI